MKRRGTRKNTDSITHVFVEKTKEGKWINFCNGSNIIACKREADYTIPYYYTEKIIKHR